MRSSYKKLGEYIRLVDERNKELAIDNLLGVSITKQFIPSIANIVGTDLSNYKIVRTGQFAYGPVTSRNGEKISVALLTGDDCIISSSYSVFEVINNKELCPEYLMLWFNRPEFDRYARYRSHGSVREIFDWEEMCSVELPVPTYSEQLRIVDAYKAIERRIELKKKINDNLDAQLRAYMANFMAKDDNPVIGKLKDYCTMQYGYTESSSVDPVGPKFLRITDIAQKSLDWSSVPYCPINDGNHSKYMLSEGDILVARTGATVGVAKMMGSHIPDAVFASFLVRIKPIESYYKYYFGLTITSNAFLEYVQTNAGGSAQPQANPPLLGEFEFAVPKPDQMIEFNSVASRFLDAMEQNELEMSKLSELKESLVNMLSSR